MLVDGAESDLVELSWVEDVEVFEIGFEDCVYAVECGEEQDE